MYIFPVHHFRPTSVSAGPVPHVVSGGTDLTGDETTIQADGGGRWAISYSGITLRSTFQLRLWDSWASYLAGGSRAVLCPILSLSTAPRPIAGNGLMHPSKLQADDERFPNSVAFASPYIIARVTAPVAARATIMTIEVEQGAQIAGGEKFAINGRGFLIERVISRPGLQSATVVVSPPAREAIGANTAANFDWPTVQSKVVIGQNLTPNTLFGRTASVSISFVEDFSAAS